MGKEILSRVRPLDPKIDFHYTNYAERIEKRYWIEQANLPHTLLGHLDEEKSSVEEIRRVSQALREELKIPRRLNHYILYPQAAIHDDGVDLTDFTVS